MLRAFPKYPRSDPRAGLRPEVPMTTATLPIAADAAI